MRKVLFGSVAFVGIYNLFFYPSFIGIGLGFLISLFHVYLFLVSNPKSKNKTFATALSLASIAFAFGIGFRSNEVVQVFDLLISIFLTIAAGYLYKKASIFSIASFSFIFIPLSALKESLTSISNFFSDYKQKRQKNDNSQMYNAILRGTIITIPIVVILFLLLTGADPIFANLASKLSFKITDQVLVSLIIFGICLIWGITIVKEKELINVQVIKLSKEKMVIESLIIVLSSVALFTIFLAVQARFLFLRVPETELHRLGINIQTYSEYTRQGFFQLIVASSIIGVILAFILKYFHEMGTKYKPYLKFGMIILTIETQLLLFSAIKRLYLYAEAHGMTRSRIFGIVFLVWLSIILIILFISILRKIKKESFAKTLLALTLSAFAAINFFPIDAFIATKIPPTINKEIDYRYIMHLSPEASGSWVPFIEKTEKIFKDLSQKTTPTDEDWRISYGLSDSLHTLNNKAFFLERKYEKDKSKHFLTNSYSNAKYEKNINSQQVWQAYNKSEYDAYLLIKNNRDDFIKIKSMIESLTNQQNRWINP